MKVCTDSCIFGAYIDPEGAQTILDIGSGTGLLSLMLAQKTNAEIDAVEIDADAVLQSEENFKNSPWNNRLHIFSSSIQNFSTEATKKYDLIISNPPFFINHLLSPNPKLNKAIHNTTLSLKELSECVSRLLSPEGKFYVLLPPYEASVFEESLKELKLFLQHRLEVKDKSEGKIIRVIDCYNNTPATSSHRSLIIKNSEGQYTTEFSELLRPYYLFL
ncbi:methyltransferase small [Sporocytophaga myxococcoides]|uniref:tRNA1(Val) (adenine(37)-N6)-methyltransferase n=1 Tax=Sporocytophaga myxococcoides TaxID=153721 RepID=A0A098L9X0_9BACT|nr:methyltransferase [Sporocytophaga myxococcoides]GAL83028.1 methyltransferase small [Sporocytophaga myxococcoides]